MNIERNSRRLVLAGLSGMGTVELLSSCIPAPFWTNRDREKKPTPRSKLAATLQELPPSPLNELLKSKLLPYFSDNPTVIAGLIQPGINIHTPIVIQDTLKDATPFARSEFRLRRAGTLEALYPIQDHSIAIPLVGLVLDVERASIPPRNFAPDGTPTIIAHFPHDKPIYQGLAPYMAVYLQPTRITDLPAQREKREHFEKATYLLNACRLFLSQVWIEEVAKRMRDVSLPMFIPVQNTRGDTIQAEIISQSIVIFLNQNGRTAAAFDLASYLLMFESVKGTTIHRELAKEPNISKVITTLSGYNPGSTPQSILYHSLTWVLTHPEMQQLQYTGDLARIP